MLELKNLITYQHGVGQETILVSEIGKAAEFLRNSEIYCVEK